MKLFLTSAAIDKYQSPHFCELVGKEAADISIGLIENAADVHQDQSFVEEHRRSIIGCGFNVEQVDIRTYEKKPTHLRDKLVTKDAIWVGGGNTYYLRWLMQRLGADKVISGLVTHGKVYGGGSAGAVIAGPTLKHFDKADDPAKAPEVIYDGLAFTNKVMVPHIDRADFAPVMAAAKAKLCKDGFEVVTLTEAQAYIVNGDQENLIG